jgi:enterochelin esterase-like enzyme
MISFLMLLAIGCSNQTEKQNTIIEDPPISSTATPSVITPNTSPASTESSQIVQVEVESKAFNRSMGAEIYLPPGYNPKQKYPVLYLLYGYGGTPHSFFSLLPTHTTADQLIQAKQIEPLIIVSPDYRNSFAVNSNPS